MDRLRGPFPFRSFPNKHVEFGSLYLMHGGPGSGEESEEENEESSAEGVQHDSFLILTNWIQPEHLY